MHYGEPDFWNKVALLAVIGVVVYFSIMSFLTRNKNGKHNLEGIRLPTMQELIEANPLPEISILVAIYEVLPPPVLANSGIMTIIYTDGVIVKFSGGETMWFSFVTGKRVKPMWEPKLNEIYQYIKKHGNPYIPNK